MQYIYFLQGRLPPHFSLQRYGLGFLMLIYRNKQGLRRTLLNRTRQCNIQIFDRNNLCQVKEGRKEGNVLFNDALKTFYLRLHSVRHGKGPLR